MSEGRHPADMHSEPDSRCALGVDDVSGQADLLDRIEEAEARLDTLTPYSERCEAQRQHIVALKRAHSRA